MERKKRTSLKFVVVQKPALMSISRCFHIAATSINCCFLSNSKQPYMTLMQGSATDKGNDACLESGVLSKLDTGITDLCHRFRYFLDRCTFYLVKITIVYSTCISCSKQDSFINNFPSLYSKNKYCKYDKQKILLTYKKADITPGVSLQDLDFCEF